MHTLANSKKDSSVNDGSLLEPTFVDNPKAPVYSKTLYFLFYLTGAYLVIPVIDVPFLGLSLSAPIFFIITVACFLKPINKWLYAYRLWIFLAIFIWMGIFISTIGNGIVSFGVNIANQGFASIIQFAYWMIIFLVTAYFANQENVLKTLPKVMAWGVFIVALLRWGEAIFLGKIGAWSGTTIMSQNGYGYQFSCFSPFLLIAIFRSRGWKRLMIILANIVLFGAVVINGSRGSWLAILIGFSVLFILLFLRNPRRFFGLLIFLLMTAVLAGALWGLFPQLTSSIESRFDTLTSLEEDKSFLVRELMVQKGLKLFQNSPIIGVGASRFTRVSVELELPGALSYGDARRFDTKPSHNSYIQVLAETGLVGSIPFIIFLLILALRGVWSTRRSLTRNEIVPAAIFMSFIQMSAHMWVISGLNTTLTWFIYGLLVAIIMREQHIQDRKCV